MCPSSTFAKTVKREASFREPTYEFFGVHKLSTDKNINRYVFRVRAERASEVALVGDFNSWTNNFMNNITDSDVWELVYESDIPIDGMRYKYRIFGTEGITYIIDPYAREFDAYPHHLSIVCCEKQFEWQDEKYIKKRASFFKYGKGYFSIPLNIYSADIEFLHSENIISTLNFRDLGTELSDYIIQNGYTHINLTDILKNGEYDISFAPNPVYGSPEDLKFFINKLHSNDIGVFLTLTDKLLSDTPDFWVKIFHIDGFCVSSENAEYKTSDFSDIIWIFDSDFNNRYQSEKILVQNLGFTKELLDYLSTDPYFRAGKHNRLTFPLLYAFSKKYILTNFSESGQKSSLFSRMFGSDTTKFSNMRLFFAAMMTYPGKKTLRAENIFPKEYVEPDTLLEHTNIKQSFYKYLTSLNKLYLEHSALWENDFLKDGFEWVCNDRGGDSVLAYKRIGNNKKELVVILNFSSAFRKKYRIPIYGRYVYYREIFNSDDECFGGLNRLNDKTITRLDGSVEVDLPPLSAIIIEPIYLD